MNFEYDEENSDSDLENLIERKKTVENILSTVPDYIQKVQCDTDKFTKPFKCAVSCCSNVFLQYDDSSPYKFHNFPTDPNLRTKWLQLCNISDDTDTNRTKVCSDHFTLNDYIRNYKLEFSDSNFKRKLNSTAIPNQNLTGNAIEIELPEPQLIEVKYLKQIVDERNELEERLEFVQKYQAELNKTIESYNDKINNKMKEIQKMRKSKRVYNLKSFKRSDNNIISQVFSDSQVQLLLNKKVRWTDDDLARAFTMRFMGGKACYLYLKNTLKLPLPALSCVQKWVADRKV